jgi:GT2 family glycosyltransferase
VAGVEAVFPSAVVICTIARPLELTAALRAVAEQEHRPDFAVVVDASATEAVETVVRSISSETQLPIVHLRSLPGLGLQRNLGLDYAIERLPKRSVVHFIDDDVLPLPGYFWEIESVFASYPDAVCVGGRDVNRPATRIPLIARLIGTNSKREGVILRTAWNIHCTTEEMNLRVDWVSGLSQSFRTDVLGSTRFNPGIRFYGEEVDMHVRCSELGTIYRTPFAEVRHLASDIGRDDEDEVALWTDGSKWMLCRNYPERFSKTLFLLATVMHMSLKALSGVIYGKEADIRTARGHARFLGRLMARKPMRQEVSTGLVPMRKSTIDHGYGDLEIQGGGSGNQHPAMDREGSV